MAINPHQAADARHGIATRTIKKLEIAIDELLRVEWRGPGRKISLREDAILKLANVKRFTPPMRDALVDNYFEAGWKIDIACSAHNPIWAFLSNKEISSDLIY